MQRDRVKRLYDLHAWAGILSAWFIFIVVFSGIPALFYEEIETWENPQSRINLTKNPVELQSLIKDLVDDVAGHNEIISVFSLLPTKEHPYYKATVRYRDVSDKKVKSVARKWNPNNGLEVFDAKEGPSYWLRAFHRNLMLDRTLGRTLVGLSGILLLLLLLTGILTHRKMIKEMFTWRLDRSIRLKWQDSHKIIGLWTLPFSIMIAFTGAFLGLLVIMLPITALLVFEGDREKIMETVSGLPVEHSGTVSEMQPILPLYNKAIEDLKVMPERILIERWGDQTAHYIFYYKVPGKLIRFGRYIFDGSNGEFIDNKITDLPGTPGRFVAAVAPLHYATFGGIWLKALYSVLAAFLCILITTGSMMWLERRLHGNEGKRSQYFYRFISRLSTGLMTGIIFASVMIFYSDKFFEVSPSDRLYWAGVFYFVYWAMALLYCLLRDSEYKSCKEVLAVSSIAILLLPIIDFTNYDAFSTLFSDKSFMPLSTNLAFIILGLISVLFVKFLPYKDLNYRLDKRKG